MDTLVVLPTYNEAGSLEAVVGGIVASSVGVLIVDDSSPDGTGRIADHLAASHAGVSVLHRTHKRGLGEAYLAGFKVALATGAGKICCMDADGSHDPADLQRLTAALDEGADMVIGSRLVSGGKFAGTPLSRRALSRMGNLYARAVGGIQIHDSTSGFRAYRRELLADIGSLGPVPQGYAFQIEMVRRAEAAGAVIREVPITFSPRSSGGSKLDLGVVVEAFRVVSGWGTQRLRQKRRRSSL